MVLNLPVARKEAAVLPWPRLGSAVSGLPCGPCAEVRGSLPPSVIKSPFH